LVETWRVTPLGLSALPRGLARTAATYLSGEPHVENLW
jgi:hypothetical protein